jgi:hypothetical protein
MRRSFIVLHPAAVPHRQLTAVHEAAHFLLHLWGLFVPPPDQHHL